MPDIIFGPFVLDPSATHLARDGVEVRLRPQALQALRVLALHSGQYVGYERLIAEGWKGVVVSRHTVDVTVGEVKRALGEYRSWIAHRPKLGYCLDIPQAESLIRRGHHFWSLRTRDGLEKALDCFERAAAIESSDFRAYEGQSVCYLMLASQGMRAPLEMYPRYLEAHARAEELAGLTPELRCNRAHGLHMFEHRLEDAEAEFRQVLRERPTLGSTYVRLSMLYGTMGRLDDALNCICRAYDVAPLLPLLASTEGCLRFLRREFDQAAAIGAQAVELHPYMHLARAFYAVALEYSGRLDEALAQYHLLSLMSSDLPWLRALEGACLIKAGREAEAYGVLAELEDRRRSEYVDAYGIALLRGALGHREEAFSELERAVDENSAGLWAIEVDPKADPFRENPRFLALREKLWHGAAGRVG